MGFVDNLRASVSKRLHPATDDDTMQLLDVYDRLRDSVTLSVGEALYIEQARKYLEGYDAHERWFPLSADQARTLLAICERLLEINVNGDI